MGYKISTIIQPSNDGKFVDVKYTIDAREWLSDSYVLEALTYRIHSKLVRELAKFYIRKNAEELMEGISIDEIKTKAKDKVSSLIADKLIEELGG